MDDEVKTTIRNLQSTLKTDAKYLSVNEVSERKTGLLRPIERTENLSKMVHNLVECLNSVAKDEVDEIMANYSNISLLKEDYFKDINNEIKNREIKKGLQWIKAQTQPAKSLWLRIETGQIFISKWIFEDIWTNNT